MRNADSTTNPQLIEAADLVDAALSEAGFEYIGVSAHDADDWDDTIGFSKVASLGWPREWADTYAERTGDLSLIEQRDRHDREMAAIDKALAIVDMRRRV